jgi:glutaredoxin 3
MKSRIAVLIALLESVLLQCHAFVAYKRHRPMDVRAAEPPAKQSHLYEMKRPFLDQVASFLFQIETDRVEKSSVVDEKGRMGEPMAWSERDSFANQFSAFIASNDIGYTFKQFVADIVAGDFDNDHVGAEIDNFIKEHPVAMFSFSTCPFCRRAKDYLEACRIPYQSIELDELQGNRGSEIRAMLGRKTRRTSVPSIFIGGQYIGGCNDGPGLLPLAESGELQRLLQDARIST